MVFVIEEQKKNYAVLRETAMDAILTETAFIDTAFDEIY